MPQVFRLGNGSGLWAALKSRVCYPFVNGDVV